MATIARIKHNVSHMAGAQMPLKDNHAYCIAEFGSNHYGNREHALRAIDVAADAGCDAVKYQLFRLPDILVHPDGNGRPGECGDPRTELPVEWIPQLADYCRERRIDFLCTPFSDWAVEELHPYVWAWKVGSFEHKRRDIQQAILRRPKPVIQSLGRGPGDWPLHPRYTLYCVSKYPAPLTDIYLPDFNHAAYDGISDHTLSTIVPALAIARGASIVEKHFRLDDTPPASPDHSFALTPAQLGEMVRNIRLAELTCWRQPPTEPQLAVYANRRE